MLDMQGMLLIHGVCVFLLVVTEDHFQAVQVMFAHPAPIVGVFAAIEAAISELSS